MEVRSDLTTAVALMKMALALLDRAECVLAAANLQHAIDIATDAPIPRTIEEVDAFLDTDEARRLLDRHGLGA